MDMLPEIMNDTSFSNNEAILSSLTRAGEIINSGKNADYWMTEEGQAILFGKLNGRGGPPSDLTLSTTRRSPMPCYTQQAML